MVKNLNRALKVRNTDVSYFALSELQGPCAGLPGATRLTLFGACPWLSYFAPSALTLVLIFGAHAAARYETSALTLLLVMTFGVEISNSEPRTELWRDA